MFVRLQGSNNVTMSFDIETSKTNEFLRRRKLRLQQVREQSKEIAKKIRQKTSHESLRYLKHLDEKIHKEYFCNQEKLVKHLENLYTEQMKQVGASHRSASCVNQNEQPCKKLDVAKERGKVATAHLRQKKQQELDHKKLLLDRKLRAREAANELSRDKSSVSTNKSQEIIQTTKKSIETQLDKENERSTEKIQPTVQFNNISSGQQVLDAQETPQKGNEVQWDSQNLPKEQEPNVPKLKLLKSDKEGSIDRNLTTRQTASERTTKSNLFAVSDEMPSSLRGGLIHRASKPPVSTKSSLHLVSQYLQTRHMRLREHPVIPSKPIDNLESIRETLMHARAVRSKAKPQSTEQNKASGSSSSMARNLVTIYNHTTRDIQDVPLGPEKIVIRESQRDEDAYSQAMKESSNSEKEGMHLKKTQTMGTRSKVAIAKQDVEKEYKDTMAFLNSLPKEKQVKALKKAYMDDYQQNAQREIRQRKMQQEFKKIERQCKKHGNMQAERRKLIKIGDGESGENNENDLNVADSMKEQYSWIPSPEGDVSFAVHKIPNKAAQNSCKESEENSYHEYRSRHKHTPPTKDMANRKTNRQSKAVIIEQSENSIDESSNTDISNGSLGESPKKTPTKKLKTKASTSAREKIIIYKILSNHNKNAEKRADETNLDSVSNIVKSLTLIDKVLQNPADDDNGTVHETEFGKNTESSRPRADRVDRELYMKENPQWENGNPVYVNEEDEGLVSENTCRHCQCGKHNIREKETSTNKGPLQWQVEDTNANRLTSSRACNECKRMNIATSNLSANVQKPSKAVSSLGSKPLNIVKSAQAHSEAKLVHIMEGDIDETNKFYVGASGILKDEDYEVIIQLRKKNQKENGKDSQNIHGNTESKENAEALNTIPTACEELTKNNSNAHTSKALESETQYKDSADHKGEVQYSKLPTITTNTRISNDLSGNQYSSKTMDASVNVCNSPQNASDFPKTNDLVTQATNTSQPRPVVTACTQTSGRNSPENRSMFVQMSSSTSTAYLSPPERVLPGYLKSRYADPMNHVEINPDIGRHEKKCKHSHFSKKLKQQ